MNQYLFIFITISILVGIILLTSYKSTVIEPFTRKFFEQIKATHFVGIDQAQLFGNEFELINSITKMMPFNINTLMIDHSLDRYHYLNNNTLQLVLSRSNEIYNMLYKLTPSFAAIDTQHIRFICALHKLPINILTTDINLNEFGDLKHSKLTVNVGPRNECDYFVAMDLLQQYKIYNGIDIRLSYYDVNELYEHYGRDVQVAIITRSHPDKTITTLLNKTLTRFVEILKYNNGNIYHMDLDEEVFYKEYQYYYKTILEKERLKNYYPNLVINEDIYKNDTKGPLTSTKSRFINTISLKYYLLGNDFVQDDAIYQLLYNMKLNMNIINQHPFIEEALNTASLTDFNLPMQIQKGASEFYMATGLYTHINNPNCLLINGRCDEKQLREHHLDNKLGPTFDELFNK
jgi:TRAP-type uncharacterized transport system substrate-binding protein